MQSGRVGPPLNPALGGRTPGVSQPPNTAVQPTAAHVIMSAAAADAEALGRSFDHTQCDMTSSG
jgi:hypothetical protein